MTALPWIALQSARRLWRSPGFTTTVVLTLALGIGATTAVFSVINGVLLQPLPYDDAGQLVDLSHSLQVSGVARVDQSDASFLHYRNANQVFSGVGAWQATAVNLAVPGGPALRDGRAERVAAARVSAGAFGVLRVTPLRGRLPDDTEDHPGAPPVLLIGQGLWRRSFGADPGIVGRRLAVDGVPHEVIGIMPEGFRFPAAGTELWLPVGIDPAKTESATFDYRAVARLRDGQSVAAAEADLQSLLLRLPEAFPGRLTAAAIEVTRMRAVVRPLRDVIVGDIGRVLWIVLGSVACVLLVACANVAGLFLVRADVRRHELAVRRALGAGQGAVVIDLLAEGVCVAALAGTIGLAIAAAGVGILRSLGSGVNIPRLDEVAVNGPAFLVAAGASVLAVLLVAALPAVRAAGRTVTVALGDAGRASTAGRQRHRVRYALVVAQTALAFVLVTAAALMARSFDRLRSLQPGFDARQAWTARVALPDAEYADAGSVTRMIEGTLQAIAALPGVQAAGAVTKLPLAPESRRDTALFVEDRPLGMGQMPNLHQVVYATPGYFQALAIPLAEGRTFQAPDPSRAVREVILSRSVAERYWGLERAVGRRVRLSPLGDWFEVVGIAGSVRGVALDQPPDEIIYLPLVTAPGAAGNEARWAPRELAIVVRAGGDPARLALPVERAIRDAAPSVPVYAARSMSDVVSLSGSRTSFTLLLLAVASAVAMVLGAVGIYGVFSYVVGQRSREIAVRLALGARPPDVRRMVARQAALVAGVGMVTGLAAALALTRLMTALLFDVGPSDPVALGAAAAIILIVTASASWLPALRAARVDPAQVLRGEG